MFEQLKLNKSAIFNNMRVNFLVFFNMFWRLYKNCKDIEILIVGVNIKFIN